MSRWCHGTGAILALAVAMSSSVAAAGPTEHVMRLMTDASHGRFRFEPPLLFAAIGDEVRLVPSSRLHGVKSMAGMLPEGVAPWRGKMGEEVRLKLTRAGVYGLKCPAHYQIGMVALIVVGDGGSNWDAARAVRHPPMPAAALERLFTTADCRLHAAPTEDCGEGALASQ